MRRILGSALALALASSCAVGPDFVRPDPPKTAQYNREGDPVETIHADGQGQGFAAGTPVPAEWWKFLNEPKLDPLVQESLRQNPNLQAALANLRQSQDLLDAGYGVFYPQANASFQASREKANPTSFGVNAPNSIFNLFTLSGTISYALDIFGGDRRALEGLRAQVDVQRYAVNGAYLTLTGNLVNAVIARAAYADEIEATRAVLRVLEEEVSITQAQVRAQTVPYSSLLSLQSQLYSVEATLPPLNQKLSQTEHLLATLSGRTPAEFTPPAIGLADLTLPARLPKTLPSELVRRRPDILQSEATLHAASAQIGVATAALYPSFTLDATYGTNHTDLGKVFNQNGSFWTLGAGITAPLFHGGTLRAQKQAAVDAYEAALATYRQTVLGGLAQVADMLRALEHDAELVQSESQAVAVSEEAARLLETNYRAGTANYLQVLTANSQYQQAKIGLVQAVAQRLQDTVGFYVALGGEWKIPEKK